MTALWLAVEILKWFVVIGLFGVPIGIMVGCAARRGEWEQ
jgi:hypothetical protein